MGEPEVGSLVAVVEGVVVVVEGHHLDEGHDGGLGVAGHEDVLDLRTNLERSYDWKFCAMNLYFQRRVTSEENGVGK